MLIADAVRIGPPISGRGIEIESKVLRVLFMHRAQPHAPLSVLIHCYRNIAIWTGFRNPRERAAKGGAADRSIPAMVAAAI